MPYAESVGAFKELQDEGKVRWVGISNANVAQIEEALGIVDVVAVQNQLVLDFTGPMGRGEVDVCARARDRVPALVAARRHRQRASGTARDAAVSAAAEAHGVSPQQVGARVAAGAEPGGDPDPGRVAPGDDPATRRARPSWSSQR